MSIVDDPPRLRLVSSSGPPSREHRYRDQAKLGPQAGALFRQVLAHSLASGVAIDPDALRVVLAVHQSRHGRVHWFTATTIWQLLFVDVIAWAKAHRLPVLPATAPALVALIDYLANSGRLDPDSDSPRALCDAIDECTGGWATDQPPTQGDGSLRSRRGPKR